MILTTSYLVNDWVYATAWHRYLIDRSKRVVPCTVDENDEDCDKRDKDCNKKVRSGDLRTPLIRSMWFSTPEEKYDITFSTKTLQTWMHYVHTYTASIKTHQVTFGWIESNLSILFHIWNRISRITSLLGGVESLWIWSCNSNVGIRGLSATMLALN